jgi:hypothetical protein
MLVPSTERTRVHDVLTALGFSLGVGVSGEFISYQASYTLSAADIGTHSIDLHWKINNSEFLSRLLSYEEILDEAVPLPKICPEALGTSSVYALLLASMHRGTHKQNPYYVDGVAYYGADRLIWIYDLHLLANSLSPSNWHDVMRLATEKGLRTTCLDGIEWARACFHTCCPEFVFTALSASGNHEATTTYLNASKVRQQWINFRALDGFFRQMRFLRELLFPPAAYMNTKYPQVWRGWLPVLYALRAFDSLLKRIKTTRQIS